LLFWTGCFGTFDERIRRVVRAFEELLLLSGVMMERIDGVCCGDPLLQVGDVFGFRRKVEENVRVLSGYGRGRIVTICPHCMDVLKRECDAYADGIEVMHHSVLLCELLESRRLRSCASSMRATFHDPCILGRRNGIYEEPRRVLVLSGIDLVEMSRTRQRSLCCGGGGARMWMAEERERRVEECRFEEALATGARYLVTACPYCLVRFDSLAQARPGRGMYVRDVAEVLLAATQLGGSEV
jgi:Fe-S oxidoreductase